MCTAGQLVCCCAACLLQNFRENETMGSNLAYLAYPPVPFCPYPACTRGCTSSPSRSQSFKYYFQSYVSKIRQISQIFQSFRIGRTLLISLLCSTVWGFSVDRPIVLLYTVLLPVYKFYKINILYIHKTYKTIYTYMMGFNTSSFKSYIVIYTNRPIVPIGITSIVSFLSTYYY